VGNYAYAYAGWHPVDGRGLCTVAIPPPFRPAPARPTDAPGTVLVQRTRHLARNLTPRVVSNHEHSSPRPILTNLPTTKLALLGLPPLSRYSQSPSVVTPCSSLFAVCNDEYRTPHPPLLPSTLLRPPPFSCKVLNCWSLNCRPLDYITSAPLTHTPPCFRPAWPPSLSPMLASSSSTLCRSMPPPLPSPRMPKSYVSTLPRTLPRSSSRHFASMARPAYT